MNRCSRCGIPKDKENGDYRVFVCCHYGTPDCIWLCSSCFCVYAGLPDVEITFGKPARKVKAIRPHADDINTLPLFAKAQP